ncbi:cytochrome C [Leptobacterium flavescens]|uniref:Cytochrome C n=1 Tax=Leptobacterium flavescens TaxID=472055 RepID=A0A6P0UNR1_9FLAO|nr:heme-binding domain-containing protein [Leptobacterium flavescens]NER11966.1 cytochrome C [Leptobacterium flavescens]
MKIVKKILVLLLIVLVIMQFIRPEKNTSDTVPATDFITMTNPSEEIKGILKTACYDCHSNNTVYPWYNNIAPVSYWLADHVKDGKKHLNFSDWGNYDQKRKAHKLEELVEEVKEHKMPLNSYLWMHKDAKLDDAQIEALTSWAQDLRFVYQLKAK